MLKLRDFKEKLHIHTTTTTIKVFFLKKFFLFLCVHVFAVLDIKT